MPGHSWRAEVKMADKDKPDPNDPSNVSAAWLKMKPVWTLIQTLLNGTQAMRDAAHDYLPQHDEEGASNYQERLDRNTLYNVTKMTLNALVGRPFSEPVKINPDVPSQLVELLDNVDLLGHDLHTFARDWMREGIAKGFAHCLIDMPTIVVPPGTVRTVADDLRERNRPFLKLISPENVIFASSAMFDGVETLVHIRIYEEETVRVGMMEDVIERIRIYEPGTFTVYRKFWLDEKRTKFEWRVESNGTVDLPYIPIVTFYAQRDGFMLSTPPLEDLAHLNVAHWQSTSDQRNVLTVARFPMLACAGYNEKSGGDARVGPRQLLGTRDPNGRWYYVEHSGKSIEAGENDLANLEDQMGNYGAEFLKKKRTISRNPQDRVYDTVEETSELQDMTLRFTVSVNTVLGIMADWLALDSGGTVLINKDFALHESNANDLQHLAQARIKPEPDVSLPTYIDTLKRLGTLDKNLSTADEVKAVKAERQENADRTAKANADAAATAAALAPKPAAAAEPAAGSAVP